MDFFFRQMEGEQRAFFRHLAGFWGTFFRQILSSKSSRPAKRCTRKKWRPRDTFLPRETAQAFSNLSIFRMLQTIERKTRIQPLSPDRERGCGALKKEMFEN